MTTVLQVLIEARKLIEKPENWCRGAYARNRSGKMVDPSSKTARRWCPVGALLRATNSAEHIWNEVTLAIERALPSGHIVPFNDEPGRAHSEVLAAFDRAIAAERAKAEVAKVAS